MIDIHTHLLPEFDDGPRSMDDTRRMLALAEKDGTTEIVLTSHILSPADFDREEEILEKFKQVKDVVKKDGRKVKIYLGGEIFLHPDTELNKVFTTFNNNGKYVLVEFGMRTIPEFVPKKIFDWTMNGIRPIIAHPERVLPIMKNPKYAYRFVQMGASLQINSGSLLGIFGDSVKKCAQVLLEHDLVHFVASDGHDIRSRSISLKNAYELVSSQYGPSRAEILFEMNPVRAILGEELIKSEPIEFEERSNGSGRWQSLKRKFGLIREP